MRAFRFLAMTVAAMLGGLVAIVAVEKAAQAGDSSFVGWLVVKTAHGTAAACSTATAAGDICAGDDIESVDDTEVSDDLTVGDDIIMSSGAVIDQSADGAVRVTEGGEDVVATFTANTVTLTSSTGVATLDFGALLPVSTSTGALGWAVVAGANTACNTTCTNACVFGVNTAATEADIVACTDATADECLCAGGS